MKTRQILTLFFTFSLFSMLSFSQENKKHQIWNELLQKNVDEKGNVNYKGFISEKAKLQKYLDALSKDRFEQHRAWNLRKEFNEPRIHFAVNCASISCPVLRNEAFEAEKIERQLHELAFRFINDPFRNKINSKTAELSKIFS